MFRRPPRPPVQPVRFNPMEGIRFIEEPVPPPAAPKKEAPVAEIKPAAKRREWPIGTLAFLAVVGAGLVLRSHGIPGGHRAHAEEELSRSFSVSTAPSVVVDTFNGPIEVERGGAGKVVCVVIKKASGHDDADARNNLRNVSVLMTQEGDTVRVSAHKASMLSDAATSVVIRVPEGTMTTLKSTNGAITVLGVEGSIDAHATNGPIRVEDATGNVALGTTNGKIMCEATDAVVAVGSTNGQIEFRGSLAPGHSSFHTTNGRVTLKLPEALAFRVDARTSNGKVSSDFDVEPGPDQRGKRLIGSTGHDPKVEIKARTSNGSIRIVEED